MKKYIGALFLLWAGAIIVVYYVVQKPGLLNIFTGLLDTVLTLLVAGTLLFNAYGLGRRILQLIKLNSLDAAESLLFRFGVGLGVLGLLGLFFSAVQLAHRPILALVQIGMALFFLIRRDGQNLIGDIHSLRSQLNLSFSQYSYFTRFAIGLTLLISFLLTLVPPFEAFDVLINHLAQPAIILRDGGLRVVDILPFWYPTLTVNVYLWALAFGSERAAQLIHFFWGLLAILLLWHWATKIWGIEIGRKTLLLLVAIPSLAMLASWAYADMPLAFYAVAALYTTTFFRLSRANSLLYATAIFAGLAMGVKYQSFVVPLTCGLLVLFQRPFSKSFGSALRFSLITLLIALPWYLRNALYMGNPFYPFLFGGRYWDQFLAAWWTEPGTGIGWNAFQIIMLPLNVILGHRDATFFDGRLGPLYLLLLPMAVWMFIRSMHEQGEKKYSLISTGCFAALSVAVWTLGVINTSALWQARYLFTAVMAFTIPTALGWEGIKQLDTSRFRASFLINVLIGLVISLTLLDNVLFVLQRNPLAVAFGVQSRERYIERVNPSYAAVISLLDELPKDAQVYNLFEPRSYALPRSVQPDTINSNFAHDIYLYQTPEAIIREWKSKGYTHILVYERGLSFLIESGKFTPNMQHTLIETLGNLKLIGQTPDNTYSIYEIP